MFAWWGRTVVQLRWWVVAVTIVVAAVGVGWGTGVFGALSGGGFDDPASPSSVASRRITAEIGRQGADLLVLYSNPAATVDEPGLRGPVTQVLDRLAGRPEVEQVVSYYATRSPAFVSADRHATYLAVRLRGADQTAKLAELTALRPALAADQPVQVEVGGIVAFLNDANKQIESDIVRAEVVSLPILLVLLILIFRGLVAAMMPLLVGGVAILGALTLTRALTSVTDISVFAANVITMLGLGMAIDYALFVVSRFREQLAAGNDTPTAIRATIATAGRTVVVSGLTVALALSSLLIFPMAFLKSMAYGGMAAVLVAMVAALTILPAVLSLLGPRINALAVRRHRSPAPGSTSTADSAVSSTVSSTVSSAVSSTVDPGPGRGWARLAGSVMRRPVRYVVIVTVLLVGLAAPFLQAEFGGFDERVLPTGTPSRTVTERLQADFPGGDVAPVTALVSGASVPAAWAYANQVATLPGVTGAAITATNGSSSLVSITYRAEPSSAAARAVVTAVRGVPSPAGAQVLVTGRPAADLDQLASLGGRLGWMALYVGVVTFVLLFLAFGSVVLPIKAIIMNIVSIGASFGVVVWIFQDGHFAQWLDFTPTGFLEPTNLILMLAILFGLSTDYEVFLLSRIREEWDRSGDNTEAVTAGLQRTGGIITAAALLLIIVIGGFATGGAETIKMLGVGTVVAVAVDAALVRTLLVPATMRLLGRWNWWAPGPLAKLYRRYGLTEAPADAPTREAEPAHAH